MRTFSSTEQLTRKHARREDEDRLPELALEREWL
jgi:hypothetical protein